MIKNGVWVDSTGEFEVQSNKGKKLYIHIKNNEKLTKLADDISSRKISLAEMKREAKKIKLLFSESEYQEYCEDQLK